MVFTPSGMLCLWLPLRMRMQWLAPLQERFTRHLRSRRLSCVIFSSQCVVWQSFLFHTCSNAHFSSGSLLTLKKLPCVESVNIIITVLLCLCSIETCTNVSFSTYLCLFLNIIIEIDDQPAHQRTVCVRPVATEGHSGAVPPQISFVPPRNVFVPRKNCFKNMIKTKIVPP